MDKANSLRNHCCGCKITFAWIGTHKTLTQTQRQRAAQAFDASHQFLSASQKLFDTSHPKYRALTSLKNDIAAYWTASTLPYTEPGIRLIPKSRIEDFTQFMTEKREEFVQAIHELDEAFADIVTQARDKLGSLFNADNYPTSIEPFFNFEYSFPSLEPPRYLKELSPEIYAAEQAKVAAKFDQAVTLAQEAFTTEFSKLVSALLERLTPNPDGTKKTFRNSAVTNLVEFFQTFQTLNITNDQQLEALINQARTLVSGIDPAELRTLNLLRSEVATGLKQIEEQLTPLITNQPRRRLLRKQPCTTTSSSAADTTTTTPATPVSVPPSPVTTTTP